MKEWFKQLSILIILIMVISLMVTAPVFASIQNTIDERIFGENRYDTAAQISQAGWKNTSDYAVLAAGMNENLVDALMAAPLAKLKNAPILLTDGEHLSSQAEAELVRLKVKTVYLTSGTMVIKPAVISKLTDMEITVKSIGGSDRFETALNIAKEIDSVQPFNELIVTTAWSNADALSAASIAAAKGVPILLTGNNSIPSDVNTYINSIKSKLKTTYVIGGTGVVSEAIKAELPNAKRAGGSNRYQTNLEILKLFANDIQHGTIYLANGENAHLVDALAGAPLAALTGSPVLLTNGSLAGDIQEYVKLNLLPERVISLGGERLVPDSVSSTLTSIVSYDQANATVGSTDSSTPMSIESNVRISGDNVRFQNANIEYSVYIQGDNCVLDNVTVNGTVFVDPGESGTATVKNVKAGKIVVLSGGKNSIHIENSEAGTLVVSGDDGTRVEVTGSTVIDNTVVTSYAILDANGGTLGTVTIRNKPGQVPAVELRGNFIDPVIVDGDSQVVLGDNTTVVNLQVNANADITIPAGSSIGTATSSQGIKANYSGAGQVNGSAIGTSPIVPGPVGGGGVAPGGSTTSAEITSMKVGQYTAQKSNSNWEVNLANSSDSTQIKYITASANADCSLKFISISNQTLPFTPDEKTLNSSAETTFDIDVLLDGYTSGNDGVSLKTFRNLFSGSETVNIGAEIYQNGQKVDEFMVKLKLR